jgi:hypothetical protein
MTSELRHQMQVGGQLHALTAIFARRNKDGRGVDECNALEKNPAMARDRSTSS